MIAWAKSSWLTAAAVGLLLVGSMVLDGPALAAVALALLVVAFLTRPRERLRGGAAAAVAFLGAALLVLAVRILG